MNKVGVWTTQDLSNYLGDPNGYLPGTKKTVSVPDPEERQSVIDFLKELKD